MGHPLGNREGLLDVTQRHHNTAEITGGTTTDMSVPSKPRGCVNMQIFFVNYQVKQCYVA